MAEILYIEDDESSQRLIKTIFLIENHNLKILLKSKEVLDYVSENISTISLILMDIGLPDTNGYELTKKIKELGYNGKIIAVTAYAMSGTREKCLNSGMDDYISKPIDIADFLKLVNSKVKSTM